MDTDTADPARWRRIRRLFSRALDLDRRQRVAWLDAECGQDAALRREIDGLLDAADGGTEIIDMTIERASLRYTGEARRRPEPPAGEAADDHRLRRAFACLESFFRHAAESRRATDPGGAATDLALAQAFSRAARDGSTGEAAAVLGRLVDAALATGARDPTADALRHWLEIIDRRQDGDET